MKKSGTMMRVSPSKSVKATPPAPRDPSSHTVTGNGGDDASIQKRPGSMPDPTAPKMQDVTLKRKAMAMPALKTTPTC